MNLEPSNAKCPRCGNHKMFFLVGDDGYFQSVFQMKCINCNSYFTVKQVFGETEMTAPPNYWIMDYFKVFCPHCGASFNDEWIYDEQLQWNYCPNCGTKLNWREEDLVKKGD